MIFILIILVPSANNQSGGCQLMGGWFSTYVAWSNTNGGSTWYPKGLSGDCSAHTDCGTCALAGCEWGEKISGSKCYDGYYSYGASTKYWQFWKQAKICNDAQTDLCLVQKESSETMTLSFKPGPVPRNHICMQKFDSGSIQFEDLK